MKADLIIDTMEFRCCHGCLPEEKTNENIFTVDFRAKRDISLSSESDSLDDTTDLQRVYVLIFQQMNIRSNLLEHLAGRIVRSLKEAFPEFESIDITVSKKNPPLSGKAGWSRVHISI